VASHHVIGVAASGDESDEPARSDQDELERQPAAGRRRGLLGAFSSTSSSFVCVSFFVAITALLA
jgi:hypothetical protein